MKPNDPTLRQLALCFGLLLLVGWWVYRVSGFVRHWTHEHWSYELLLDPLLVCMVAGFTVQLDRWFALRVRVW